MNIRMSVMQSTVVTRTMPRTLSQPAAGSILKIHFVFATSNLDSTGLFTARFVRATVIKFAPSSDDFKSS